MSFREAIAPLADAASDRLAAEYGYWREELARPWREGGTRPAARAGRWIGVGLAVGALVAGVAAALRVERPWE